MKKLVLFLACAWAFSAQAQVNYSVSEDFESYQNEAFLGVANPTRWKVLFNDPASVADVKVSNKKAKSGTKSIYLFSSLQGGGPESVYMPLFQNEATERLGSMNFSMWMYIPSDQGAYFSFEGADPVLDAPAVQVYFDNSSNVRLVNENDKTTAFGVYKQNQWFKFELKVNLTANEWSFYIADKLFVTQSLNNNSLYAMYITPKSPVNQSEFYIDDISYTFNKDEQKDIDALVTPIEMNTRFLVGKSSVVKAQLRNVGKNDLNSVELEWSDGLDTKTQILTNLGLKPYAYKAFTLDLPYVAKVGADKVTIKVKNVNGAPDLNPANDVRELPINVVVPTPDKKVFGEQATGTWCQWCPRGHVLMERMAEEYPDYFVGIAVHGSGNDPMRMNAYVDKLKIQGYPSVSVNRKEIVDPYEVENQFYEYISKPVAAKLATNVQWTSTPRTLKITPKATFKAGAANGTYRIVVILAEDSIKGNSALYNQINAYGSGQAGEMGGFEKLPVSVPYTKIAYKHVARALLNTFEGEGKAMSDIKEGDEFAATPITYEVPAAYQLGNLEVFTALVAPDGTVDNAISTTAKKFILDATEVAEHPFFKGISPNPANDLTIIDLNIKELSNITINMLDINGNSVGIRDFGKLEGEQRLSISTNELPTGLYIVQIQIGNQLLTRKLMVAH